MNFASPALHNDCARKHHARRSFIRAAANAKTHSEISEICDWHLPVRGYFYINLPGTLIEGLDLHEHGFPAYPEYVVTGEDGGPKTIDDVPVGRRTQYKLPKIRSKEVA